MKKYNVIAKRNGKNSVFNKKPLNQKDAEALAADLKKAKMPSVDPKSIYVDLIMESDMKLTRIYESEIENPINEEELLGHIAEYSTHSDHFFKKGSSFGNAIRHVVEVATNASRHIVEREDDWFNKITIKRDAKSIKRLAEDLRKLSDQHNAIKQDASALYEDIGQRLQRYYKVESSGKKQLGEVEAVVKKGDVFNFEGTTWKVQKAGETQSRAVSLTKSSKGKTRVVDNKIIVKSGTKHHIKEGLLAEYVDDNLVDRFYKKKRAFKKYFTKNNGYQKQDVKMALYDFGYENGIDFESSEDTVDYIADTWTD